MIAEPEAEQPGIRSTSWWRRWLEAATRVRSTWRCEPATRSWSPCTGAPSFIDAGRALSELHLGYESAKPYPLDGLPDEDGEGPSKASDAAYQRFRVEKMRFGKPTAEQKQAGLRDDRTTIAYNDRIILRGVPEEAYRYTLGSRSAVAWIMERYQVKVDKPSQIRNDPNDWSREVGNPRLILDLLARIVTVSLETMRIVDALPPLDVLAQQQKE